MLSLWACLLRRYDTKQDVQQAWSNGAERGSPLGGGRLDKVTNVQVNKIWPFKGHAASSILFQKYDAIIISIITLLLLLLLLLNGWVVLTLHYSSHKYSNKLKKGVFGVFVPLLEHLLVLTACV